MFCILRGLPEGSQGPGPPPFGLLAAWWGTVRLCSCSWGQSLLCRPLCEHACICPAWLVWSLLRCREEVAGEGFSIFHERDVSAYELSGPAWGCPKNSDLLRIDLLLLSHKSPRLFSFLPLFLCLCLSLSQTIFSVMFRLGNSYGSIFQFTDAFLCPSILIHVCLSTDFLFWLLHFAVLAFSFSSSLYFLFLYFLFFLFSISLLRLYIFLLVSS